MFSIFPPLLAYSAFSALLLRLTLGAVFIVWGQSEYKKMPADKNIPLFIFYDAIGILLIVGFLTQLAALASTITLGVWLFGKFKSKALLTNGLNYYLILFIISVCLIFTGAGFMAFDLPL